jgi:Flp pilus assembly protein TadB
VTTYTAIGVLAGCGFGLGVILLLVGLRKREPAPPRPPGRFAELGERAKRFAGLSGSVRERQARQALLLGAGLAGVGVYVLTGVIALALVAGYVVIGAPLLLQTGKGPQRRIARQAALAQWTRALSVRIATGSGLEQALSATAAEAPEAIAPQVQAVGARLEAGWSTPDVLAQWAIEVSDPTADYIAAALRRAAIRRGSGLSLVLDRLAQGVESRVRMWQKIEAERARMRTTVRLVNVIMLGMFIALQFDGTFMQPYHEPVGQVVLIALAAGYTVCLFGMDRLARGRGEPRLIGRAASAAPAFKAFGGGA